MHFELFAKYDNARLEWEKNNNKKGTLQKFFLKAR